MSSKFQASQAKPMFDPTNHRPNNPPNNSSNFLKATRQQINVHKQTTTNTKERSVDRPRQQPEAIYDHSRGSNGINYVGTRTRRLNERRQMNNRRTRHRISVFFSMFIGPRYPFAVSLAPTSPPWTPTLHTAQTRFTLRQWDRSFASQCKRSISGRLSTVYRVSRLHEPVFFLFLRSVHLVSEHLPRETRSHLRKERSMLILVTYYFEGSGLYKWPRFLKVMFFHAKLKSKEKG